MKYFANFSCNNGTSYMRPIEGNNKYKLLRDVKSTLRGNIFPGNNGTYRVFNEDGRSVFEGSLECDYAGRMHWYECD